ncbi:MAG: FAD binding domain-containing protein, partial [Acidimicrobiia bacterium]|nr:FAD binding domain-containing protein [Acidimicrobiia bacterium]
MIGRLAGSRRSIAPREGLTMIRKYHRPSSLEGALDLLARGDVVTVLLGGGTVLNGLPAAPADEVVDLQGLALDGISSEGTTVTYGAMARLQDVVDNGWTPPLLRHLARGELPSTL